MYYEKGKMSIAQKHCIKTSSCITKRLKLVLLSIVNSDQTDFIPDMCIHLKC